MGSERKYKSHLPVLKLIFDFVNIKNVFEYGCGKYSTRFFVNNSMSVTSVEMQHLEWYEKIKKEIVSDKLELLCKIGETDAIEYFKTKNYQYDLIFVDGIARENCVRSAFRKTEIIVIHDISLIRWDQKWKDLVKIPENYYVIIMTIAFPHTSVITSNVDLFCHLKKFKGIIIKDCDRNNL